MLKNIVIQGFKCFDNESIELKPLTIITGTNSSGKSSLIQAILFSGEHNNLEINRYLTSLGSFDDLKNKYLNPRKYSFTVTFTGGKEHCLEVDKDPALSSKATDLLAYPKVVTYLNANRNSFNEINTHRALEKADREFSIDGKYIASYYDSYKDEPLEAYLIANKELLTLEGQVNHWINKIVGLNYELQTEKVGSSTIKAFYKNEGLEFKPDNIGTGVSYLSALLIACLSAKTGNIIMIENPEIHLHPKSQSNLAEFFAFIASRGIQLIIETHNDHLINRTRYEVFKGNIKSEDVIIHYKNPKQTFQKIEINSKGMFVDEHGENSFPEGFYDATLKEIFAINTGEEV